MVVRSLTAFPAQIHFSAYRQFIVQPIVSFLHRPLVAHLVVHQAVTREVVSSRLRPDQHSGSLNN